MLLANAPLPSRKLAQHADLADGTQARTLVRKLNTLYDQENSAFRIEEVAGGFQLLTRPQFGPWLRRLHDSPVDVRLSGPALETLAVIAYRQPALRAELEAIRGVQCGEIVKQLMERELVRIVGRSQELGRPFLYGTTNRFLQVFGLKDLDDLPRASTLRQRAESLSETDDKSVDSGLVNECQEEPEVMSVVMLEDAQDEARDESPALEFATTLAPARADSDYEEEDDDDVDDDDDDEDLDDDEDDYDDDYDEDFEDEDWEEVDDEDEDEWDDDDDDDDDDDWEDDDFEEDEA